VCLTEARRLLLLEEYKLSGVTAPEVSSFSDRIDPCRLLPHNCMQSLAMLWRQYLALNKSIM
jgi:hypothetical protein